MDRKGTIWTCNPIFDELKCGGNTDNSIESKFYCSTNFGGIKLSID